MSYVYSTLYYLLFSLHRILSFICILYTYLLIGFHMLCLVKDFITCTPDERSEKPCYGGLNTLDLDLDLEMLPAKMLTISLN